MSKDHENRPINNIKDLCLRCCEIFGIHNTQSNVETSKATLTIPLQVEPPQDTVAMMVPTGSWDVVNSEEL